MCASFNEQALTKHSVCKTAGHSLYPVNLNNQPKEIQTEKLFWNRVRVSQSGDKTGRKRQMTETAWGPALLQEL